MPEMPAWAVEIARQFPVLVIVLLVVWFAVKYVREQHVAHIGQLQQRFDEQVKAVQDANLRLVESLTGWVEDLKRERDRLNRELNRRDKS